MSEENNLNRLELLSEHGCYNGVQRFYKHMSDEIGLPMRFALYLPPQAVAGQQVSLLTYLAGLTCTEETGTMKAGMQRLASELGLALLMPDTSPRHTGIEGEDHHWDFGVGAGFYLDATEHPWAGHWCMESYLIKELVPGVVAEFNLKADKLGITGHSMGGHGALTLALRNPGRFQSVSAFAPICAPSQCPWGHKAFTGYLGMDNKDAWAAHDATELMAKQSAAPYPGGILIDQGMADQFLAEQLYPDAFEAACSKVGQPLNLRRHEGYDHGYYFITTFVDDHLRHHASQLT
ncbi:S-formylglutathione hydrolase [Hydrogenophaga sp. 5NK40-0174]|uniref:S-formylglutathione hydrolase n=1 Tax=Hydrogenophaga sp. 5NK40-0174 TaxID=3127649 RepID=UPI003102D711